jgi:fumarate reductase flavoprotein subunit
VAKGPFYAIRMQGSTPLSTVGLAVDDSLRVARKGREPVPNLYAIGEVLGFGATAGNAFVGGGMLTPAMTFGKLLGEKMLKFSA